MCVEPNDAEQQSLHESDDEISELQSEILALKVEGKKTAKYRNIEDSTTLILSNPNDPEKGGPRFELRLTINYVTIKPWIRTGLLRCQVS